MNLPGTPSDGADQAVALVVRRTINASAERLFAAWTEPAQLAQWWGPETVTCTGAEIDLTVGGRYRIANKLPDGSTLWIGGVFEHIDPPDRLVYSWQSVATDQPAERVTVRFVARGNASTEVIISHERITDPAVRASHEHGWLGCLDGLAGYIATIDDIYPAN